MSKGITNIALITLYFPPQIGVAVNRMRSFAEYLADSNTHIHVFTIKSHIEDASFFINDNITVYSIKNFSFLLKNNTKDKRIIHNLKTLWNIAVRKVVNDEFVIWKRKILLLLDKKHKESNFDYIISSFSPITTHLIALEFLKKHNNIRWIADMRDEMSLNLLHNHQQRIYFSKLEKEINDKAYAITCVSEPIAENFKILTPKIKHILTIKNGFSHDLKPLLNFNTAFQIVYAGTFYKSRKPDSFFKALELLYHEGFLDFNWEILFVGTHHNFNIPELFKPNVKFIPPISNDESIKYIMQADCLLLIHPPSTNKGIYTGKLFEYISAKKPILAIIDKDDVAAQLIEEYKAGFIADFYDINEIKKCIIESVQVWKDKKTIGLSDEMIQKLHRKHQIQKLKNFINSK